jgi:hypothetical protein
MAKNSGKKHKIFRFSRWAHANNRKIFSREVYS